MRKLLPLSTLLLLISGMTLGCGHSSDTPPPPTPDAFAKRIEGNTHMSDTQKAAALETIRGRQEAGKASADARQKRASQH